MKRRIAIWASVGFAVACCFVLFTFVAPADYLSMTMKEPAGEAIAFISCPLAFAVGRHFPLPFWCVPLMSAATYAVIGLIIEVLHLKSSPRLAI